MDISVVSSGSVLVVPGSVPVTSAEEAVPLSVSVNGHHVVKTVTTSSSVNVLSETKAGEVVTTSFCPVVDVTETHVVVCSSDSTFSE